MSVTQHFLTSPDFCRLVGVAGFLLYMASFAALQLEWIDGHGFACSLLNIAAACLVLISLTADFNLASALIQASWIAIGAIGVGIRLWHARKRKKRYETLVAMS